MTNPIWAASVATLLILFAGCGDGAPSAKPQWRRHTFLDGGFAVEIPWPPVEAKLVPLPGDGVAWRFNMVAATEDGQGVVTVMVTEYFQNATTDWESATELIDKTQEHAVQKGVLHSELDVTLNTDAGELTGREFTVETRPNNESMFAAHRVFVNGRTSYQLIVAKSSPLADTQAAAERFFASFELLPADASIGEN